MWTLLATIAWDLHKTPNKVTGIYVHAMENFFRPPNRTTREKVVPSRSDCENKKSESLKDSGASLHMMCKNELTSLEKYYQKIEGTHRHQSESTVTTTANGS